MMSGGNVAVQIISLRDMLRKKLTINPVNFMMHGLRYVVRFIARMVERHRAPLPDGVPYPYRVRRGGLTINPVNTMMYGQPRGFSNCAIGSNSKFDSMVPMVPITSDSICV